MGGYTMEDETTSRIGDLYLELLLATQVLAPQEPESEELFMMNRHLLKRYGIVVNDLETTILECSRIGSKIILIGKFSFDIEKMLDGRLERMKSEGIITGKINDAGEVYIKFLGNHFKFDMKIANVKEISRGIPVHNNQLEVRKDVSGYGEVF
jgi:hypothetical protein